MRKKKAAAKAADENIFSFDCNDEDENVYLSSILDVAVRRYFEFVFSK